MNILIVDDDNIFRKHISKALMRRGYRVTSVDNGKEAVRMAADTIFDAAFVDMKMPDMNGIEVVRELKEMQPALKSVILTGYGSIATAVEAMKIGAYNYLIKPCEIEEMESVIRAVASHESGVKGRDFSEIYHGIAGNSPAIQKVISIIRQVKDSPFAVLITGESGTGKELTARAVHFDSIRKERPFIAINCASLKPDLLENELFGHVKGAFTGATDNKDGLLKVADGGTLFIDEIGDMNLTVQASLLRFLETGIFRPLGSTRELKVDVRIAAAINKDIEEEVKAKRFRHDLYYRLNVCRINMPPLRDRKEDVPILAKYFLLSSPLAKERGIAVSDDSMGVLTAYRWPGNVRELFNILSRAMLLSNGNIITKGIINSILPDKTRLLNQAPSAPSLDAMGKRYLLESLNANNWNITKTAAHLGIDRRTLQRKIAKYQIKKNASYE
ncbi:MAG: sigma-54-dependent Fis family transcriptional regulator [Deltaproteobacteria bacterium]|nr:sigma-54-dependent Fis family transcriptional regulator [Deltaproteobacteria bacterium]